jgi:hypothetical protein
MNHEQLQSPQAVAAGAKAREVRRDPQRALREANLPHSHDDQAKILARLSAMPETMRPCYLRAMKGNSPAAAIRHFCIECMGDQRSEVANCTAVACSLHPYRPFTTTEAANQPDPEEV